MENDGCVQKKCYHVVIGNVCALHIEPTLFFFFHFLSPLIILSHPFQTRRHTQISILCTLVVSFWP
jgi:hypothetical protein